jgi:Zn-dependent peptidase ImmA (M78 family)
MIKNNKSSIVAQQLLSDCGMDEITDIPLDLFTAGLDIILIEEDTGNCDGKIVFGANKAIIKVNSKIQFPERKRFVIAHEIGHFLMHKNLTLPEDTFGTFNIIAGTEKYLRNGQQELEANEFASELLMPSKLFMQETERKKFTPTLIKQLSQRFKTSLTATIFRYLQLDLYPICVVLTENEKVKFWKKSDELKVWVKDITKLNPPSDSVAHEYIQNDYNYLYSLDQKAQQISKSVWFELMENEDNTVFYEYCIPTKRYRTILSVVWED